MSRMSDTCMDVEVRLKVMVNKQKTKVLFAEAGSDFADILLSFLTLPLGRIVKLLEMHYGSDNKAPVLGSITSLYKGLANLDTLHFSTTAAKQMLLDPKSCWDSTCLKLKLDISHSEPTKYFSCNSSSCEHRHENISLYYENTIWSCSYCGSKLNKQVDVQNHYGGNGFTSKTASFIITDDLRMMPYTTGFVSTLTNLGITGADGAQLRNLTLKSDDEIMKLLKCCLFSKTPLSDFVLDKSEIFSSAAQPEAAGFLFHQFENEKGSNSKNIILRVMVKKSTNKLLFAQAEYDFIELLCSFLMIPIAGVESLLDNTACLRVLHNLHRIISDVTLDKYFPTSNMKERLTNPTIPHFYISQNTLLPLHEQTAPSLSHSYTPLPLHKQTAPSFSSSFTRDLRVDKELNLHPMPNGGVSNSVVFKSPKGEHYVKESITYMVTDDLSITPFCITSGFSFLDRLSIPFSDVVELEVPIGVQEGLSILKASISSNAALTNGLMNLIPKLER